MSLTLTREASFGSSAPDGRRGTKEGNMNRKINARPPDDMRPEYDFSGVVRGKFYKEYMKGTNVVLLDPMCPKSFRIPEQSMKRSVSLHRLPKDRPGANPRKQRRHNKRPEPPAAARRVSAVVQGKRERRCSRVALARVHLLRVSPCPGSRFALARTRAEAARLHTRLYRFA